MARKILILCGSDSDFSQISSGLAVLRMAEARGEAEVMGVEVCSAHRNSEHLRKLLEEVARQQIDVVVMCAGKLAALFGDCDAISRNEYENNHAHFIAVPLGGKTEDASEAAHLSAKEVPNSQFIFKEDFFGNPEKAFEYAINGELPQIILEKQKPPKSFGLNNTYHLGRRKYQGKAAYDNTIYGLEMGGFIHMYTGKTRESFLNPKYPDLLYILATDRISIFDIVLNALIHMKGAVLTAMTVFWLKKIFTDIPNHLVAYGGDIRKYLPVKITDADVLGYLMKHMIVVKRTDVLKVEAIVRGYLTGSGYKDYKNTGKVCEIELSSDMMDGSKLPEPIFTPSTKADYGFHDENISYEEVEDIIGKDGAEYIKDTSLRLYGTGGDHLREAGIISADTKFEFGKDPEGRILLIDEILTPDSSRFWPEDGWKEALRNGTTPPSYDKQPIRDAGKAAGVKANPDWVPPVRLLLETRERYLEMVRLATGKSLERFWIEDMLIFE